MPTQVQERRELRYYYERRLGWMLLSGITYCGTRFEGCENTDVIGMVLALSTRAVIAEEHFNAVGEVGCLLPIDMDDQG